MKGPQEKPLGLDMGFGEALRRFIGTSPAELAANVEAEKKRRRPPERSSPEEVDNKPLTRPPEPLV